MTQAMSSSESRKPSSELTSVVGSGGSDGGALELLIARDCPRRSSSTHKASRVPWRLSSTNGPRRRDCAAAENRTFTLDSRASVPDLHHDTRGDPVGQYAGGGGVLPRSPSSPGGRSGQPAMSGRLLRLARLSCLPATVRRASSPTTRGWSPCP